MELRGLPEIWTEGKTDWKILKRAQQNLRPSLKIKFHETEKNIGDEKLLRKLETFSERENSAPIIFVFDRDNPEMVAKVYDSQKGYKEWGNNVYSLVLPIPTHRPNHKNICIELLFTDEEIHLKDSKNRSLFLTSDFHENSGNYIHDFSIHCTKTGYIKEHIDANKSRIVDNDVFNSQNENVALSKADFADNIYKAIQPFHNFDFKEFEPVFENVEKIILENSRKTNPFYLEIQNYLDKIENEDVSLQCASIVNTFNNITSLALQIFIISVVRFYETQIINEHSEYKRKVAPIKNIITDSFRQPTLKTLTDLAVKCYHLVDSTAPTTLRLMKDSLNASILLGSIGQMWDELDVLFPQEHGTQKQRLSTRKDFLTQALPELSDKLVACMGEIEQRLVDSSQEVNVETWKRALRQLIEILSSAFSVPVYFRTIKHFDPATNEHTFDVKEFSNGIILEYEEKKPKTSEDYEIKATEIQLGEDIFVHTYPFLLMRNESLYFYKRTLPTKYEYYSIVFNETHFEPTRTKFSSSIFVSGSKQDLFWTDVIPSINEVNGVKSNIPQEGPGEFIGRRKKINQIKDEILNIVNENGIIYGPGGIGKTALMIQLTKELYNEKKIENVLFKNIIWVSAKNDFYDYIRDSVEIRNPQIENLGHVLFAVLRFFEIEDLDEYGIEDLKELAILLLQEHSVLLVVDNFETIRKEYQDQIIEFFGTRIKQELRKTPANFKVILTSREMIPSGFHQIELTGLDLSESKKLMMNLHKQRYHAATELSDEQKTLLHETTKGVPILLKHCLARIYEYNESFDKVVRNLPTFSTKIVQFSFQEILDRMQREKYQVGIQILILLDIVNRPLMIRQMADILDIDELLIENSLPMLANFECVKRKMIDSQEKYMLNDEISLLAKSLSEKHRELYQSVRSKYFKNFSIDKQMDYTSEEENLITIFRGYLRDNRLSEASDFMKEQLRKRPESIIMNYYYAKYLQETRIDIPEAIRILERLTAISGNHPSVLRLLFTCYATMEIPSFEKANNLISQIASDLGDDLDVDIKIDIARFYIRWSTYLRHKKGIDRFEDNQRIHEYKEKAQNSLDILLPIERRLGDPVWNKITAKINKVEVYYLLSQGFFHLWDYPNAVKMINKAISLAGSQHPSLRTYEKLKFDIQNTQDFYSKNPWAGRAIR